MPRVKRGVTARARHKKIFTLSKGYRLRRNNVFRVAKQAVMRAGQYAYRDRRDKKHVFRRLWIARINAGSRANGLRSRTPDSAQRKAEESSGSARVTELFFEHSQRIACRIPNFSDGFCGGCGHY